MTYITPIIVLVIILGIVGYMRYQSVETPSSSTTASDVLRISYYEDYFYDQKEYKEISRSEALKRKEEGKRFAIMFNAVELGGSTTILRINAEGIATTWQRYTIIGDNDHTREYEVKNLTYENLEEDSVGAVSIVYKGDWFAVKSFDLGALKKNEWEELQSLVAPYIPTSMGDSEVRTFKIGESYEHEGLKITLVDTVNITKDNSIPYNVLYETPGSFIGKFTIEQQGLLQTHYLGSLRGNPLYMKPDYEVTKNANDFVSGLKSVGNYRIGIQGVNPLKLFVANTARFESVEPGLKFNFDYPVYEGLNATIGTSSVNYENTSFGISWRRVAIKVDPNFWESQEFNPKGVRYYILANPDTGKKTVVFGLQKQGTSVAFTFSEKDKNMMEFLLINTFEDNNRVIKSLKSDNNL